MTPAPASFSRRLVVLVLCCWALLAALAIRSPLAAADEGDTTTTEPPVVVETPTETEVLPELPTTPSETPVPTQPHETTGGATTTPAETPKAPVTGSQASGGGTGGGGGASTGGSSTTSGGSTAVATKPAGTDTSVHGGRVHHPASSGGSSKTGTRTGGAGHEAPSSAAGSGNPQPTVSPKEIDAGAHAVSHVASHVGEVFAHELPTAPLRKIGTRLATHVGLIPAREGAARKHAVDRIGTALGAALIGSAVAVDRAPAASHDPIPFIDPPGGKSGTIYLILIAALLLAVGAMIAREVRATLGLNLRPPGVLPAEGESPGARRWSSAVLPAMRELRYRWSTRVRQLGSTALAGLRSLF